MVSSMGQLGNNRSINRDDDGKDARSIATAAKGQGQRQWQWQLQWDNGVGVMAMATRQRLIVFFMALFCCSCS
jgi:hypothetical protein